MKNLLTLMALAIMVFNTNNVAANDSFNLEQDLNQYNTLTQINTRILETIEDEINGIKVSFDIALEKLSHSDNHILQSERADKIIAIKNKIHELDMEKSGLENEIKLEDSHVKGVSEKVHEIELLVNELN